MIWTLLSERLVGVSVDLAILAVLVWGALRLLRPRSPRLVALLWLLVMVRPLVGLALGPAILLDLPAVRLGTEGQYVERREEVYVAGSAARASSEISEPRTLASTAGWLWAAGLTTLVLVAAVDRLRLRRLLSGAPSPLRPRSGIDLRQRPGALEPTASCRRCSSPAAWNRQPSQAPGSPPS